MRPPLLALLPLAFAVAFAPIAPVRLLQKKVVAPKRAEEMQCEQGAPAGDRKDNPQERNAERTPNPAPARAQWSALNPVLSTGGAPPVDDNVGSGEYPELAPALYARRLPVAPRVAAPPTVPDRTSVKSGHLSLPPPVA